MGVTGREATMAFGVLGTNSWGVPTSVTRRVYFDSDAGLTTPPAYVDDTSFGQTFLGAADIGDFAPADVSLSGQMYYDHADYILEAMAMGSPNAVTVVSSAAANSLVAYQHIIDLAPNTQGRQITVASDNVLYVEELTSAKVSEFGFSVGNGGVLQKSFRLIGGKSTNSSAVNTRSAVAASAVAPTLSNRVFKLQGQWQLNTQAAGSLTATDVIADVIDATFQFQRPLQPGTPFGQSYTAEPLDNGFPSGRITLKFRQATTVSTNSFYAALQAGTVLKGRLTFTGSSINATTNRSYALEFPHAEVQGHTFDVSGATQAQPDLTLVLKNAGSTPTGFSHTRPFRITRVTTQSLIAF